MFDLRRLTNIRAGGRVERCHTTPHVGSYSNAAHQWGVAILMQQFWPEDFPRLAMACLTHDVPEFYTGDFPSPVLGALPELKDTISKIEHVIQKDLGIPVGSDLAEEDLAKIKACDKLELYIWCLEQRLMGNRNVEEFIAGLNNWFYQTPDVPSEVREALWKLEEHGLEPPKQVGTIGHYVKEAKKL